MQISHGIYPSSQAGTEIYTTELAEALAAQGVDVAVVIPASSKTHRIQQSQGLPPYVFPVERTPRGILGNKLRYLTFREPIWKNELRRLIHHNRPDVIHIQHAIGFGLSLFELVANLKIPLVITLPDYWLVCPGILRQCGGSISICAANCCEESRVSKFGRIASLTYVKARRRWVMQFVTRSRPRMEAISDATRHIFEEEGFPKDLIHTHPWGINFQPFRNSLNKRGSKSQPQIGFLGSIRPHKGCHVLAEAFAQLRPINATLHFHGGGDDAYIEQLKSQFSGDDILFHGQYNHGSVAEILAGLDVVVIPSLWEETYCLVAQEAMAARRIVIASNVGGLSDRIRHGINGFLVPPNDSDALGAELSRLLPLFPKICENMDFNSCLLDINDDAQRWISVYEETIAESKSRSRIEAV